MTSSVKARLSFLPAAVATGAVLAVVSIGLRALGGRLGANPVATALNQLGLLALVLLIACLACSPLKELFGWRWPIRIRKTLGLSAFFVALLHFSVYLGIDQGFDLLTVLEDVTKRPFIAVGFIALCLLVPLALTSTQRALQRMGFVAWKRLHRLVYVAGALACLHFFWRVKRDLTQPLVYAAVLAVLLGIRAIAFSMRSRARLRKTAR